MQAGDAQVTVKMIPLAAVLIGLAGPAQSQESTRPGPESTLLSSTGAGSRSIQTTTQFRSVDEEIQAIKKEVLELTADLFLLEKELLYPANSQVAFFLSMNVGEYFDLESVSLNIDGEEVANYLYTQREVGALHRGGVQRLHIENLGAGDHELTVVLAGEGVQLKDYRRSDVVDINKGIGAKYVELEITDRVSRQQPEFVIREWE